MSTQEGSRRFDRAAAEQLLSGGSGTAPGSVRLAAVLAAASSPVRPDELRGERAAVAAFRAAQQAPAGRPRRLSMLKTTLAKFLTVKIGALCLASLGVGGVALAASTGNLPAAAHLGSASAPTSASHRPHPSGRPPVRPSQSLPPGLWAQCHDYLGRDKDRRAGALNEPGFHDLITHAGAKDRDKVDGFCGKLLHDWPSGSPSAWPSGRDDRPSGQPSSRPTGAPVPSERSGQPGQDTHSGSGVPASRPADH
jgi:hypothetical protein